MISAAGHSAPCVRCNKWIHREPKSHSSIPPGHCRLLAVIPSLFLRLDTMPAQRDAAPRVGIPTPRWAVQQCILHLKWQNASASVRRCRSTRRQFESPPGRPVQRCPQSSSQRVATPAAHRRDDRTRRYHAGSNAREITHKSDLTSGLTWTSWTTPAPPSPKLLHL